MSSSSDSSSASSSPNSETGGDGSSSHSAATHSEDDARETENEEGGRVHVSDDPLAGDFALALSGGGYRAGAYHLGVLDILHRVGLAEQIDTLSTISGGTIAGAMYAHSRIRNRPFPAFYDQLYTAMRDCNVVKTAFSQLLGDSTEATPSLIQAAADVYATDTFVGDVRFAELMNASSQPGVPNQLVFSATEFRKGRAYRFQTSAATDPVFGSLAPLDIPKPVARKVRVADAIAASSCFPSGFEPFSFPDRFDWGGESIAAIHDQLGATFPASLPLMDGGVFDNQGVNGIRTVYRRKNLSLGWLLVSDSTTASDEVFYTPPSASAGFWTNLFGGVSLNTVATGGVVLGVAALMSAAILAFDALHQSWTGETVLYNLFVYLLPILFAVGVLGALVGGALAFTAVQKEVKQSTSVDLWAELKKLSVRDLYTLLLTRAKSLVALTSDVFMKRIRGLVQKLVFTDETYEERTTFALLYHLSGDGPRTTPPEPWLQPSPALREVATTADDVGTTLWYTNEENMRAVIATGQATACYSILCFLLRHYEDDCEDASTEAGALFCELRSYWETLQDTPYALVRTPGATDGPGGEKRDGLDDEEASRA